MNELQALIRSLKNKLPNLEDYLVKEANEEQLKNLVKELDDKQPESLLKLYGTYNGENEYVGLFAGFEFLSVDRLIYEYKNIKGLDYELEAVGTKCIQEKSMNKCNWVPLAFDASRCYIIMDLSPTKQGKVGQIIGIDLDYGRSYLLADSLETFFEKLTKWVDEGSVIIGEDGERQYITEKSGHLFNNIEAYALIDEAGKEVLVSLEDDFWKERYKGQLKEDAEGRICVSSKVLACEKNSLFIKEQSVSCRPLQYMENINELIIHNSELRHFEYIAKMPNISKLILVSDKIVDGDLSLLKDNETLKVLKIVRSNHVKGLEALIKLLKLKELCVSKIDEMDLSILGHFTRLNVLELEELPNGDFSFLTKLTKLKELHINKCQINDLDFLFEMKKLEKFYLTQPAIDERGLAAVPELTKLKEFIYPVRNLEIYKNHPSLINPGFVVSDDQSYDVFSGTAVTSFTIIGSKDRNTEADLERLSNEIGQYVKLSSYGAIG